MSEPLSAHEIEDVLSSIRRLVSEELRPAQKATSGAGPAAAAPEGAASGKLLLTPSLRVVPTVVPAPPVDETPAPLAASADIASDFIIAREEESVFFGEAAPLGSARIAGEDEAGSYEASGPYDVSGLYDDAGLDLGGSGLQVVIDSLSVTQSVIAAHESEDFAHSGHESTAFSGVPVSEAGLPAASATVVADLPDIDWMQEPEEWSAGEAVPFIAHPRRGAEPEEKPGDAGSDPLARAWADRAEAEVRAELNARAEAGSAPAGIAQEPGLFEQDHTVIDEDMLRDIVRALIREELAGTLGERITRNVRKLVRLEVNRALTSRDFE